MPSDKPQLKTYTEKWIKDKLSYIAKQECRSDSKQLEYAVLRYIQEYESIHGELIIEEDGTIHPKKKRTNDMGKSSNYKVG